jgi:hypothetical protein
MTQPTEQPTNAQQRRVQRGARIALETRKQIRGRVTEATAERIVVQYPGTVDIDKQLADLGADTQAHLVFTVAHATALADLALMVFIDTPQATNDTPVSSVGFAGSVAFFEHEGGGHGRPQFRVPLTAALRRSGPRQTALTSTFVPVALPGRPAAKQPLVVNTALHLTQSKVERR